MLVDEIGDCVITNDGATILRQLEVEHPAAKVIVELSQLQDKEVGDGTTTVVILASELLRRANELIKNKVHPTSIISGYKLAVKEACKYIQDHLTKRVDDLGKDALVNAAKTSMSSKLIGPESTLFAELVVEAMLAVKYTNVLGEVKAPLKSVNVLKCHGQASSASQLIRGYGLQMSRVSQQMPTRVENCKVACLDFNLNKFRLQMGVQVLVNDPNNLEKIRQRECDILKERVDKILKAGANVILTTKGVDDIASKYFVEAKAIALRRVTKQDLRRIAKATGATVVTTLATPEGDEVFEPASLGTCAECYEETVGDNEFVFLKGFKNQSAVTIMIRGANEWATDEIERSVHDSLCVVKRTLESGTVVAGGGAVEVALNIYLEDFATNLGSKEQIAVAEFAEALTVIPKILATNAALDATDLVSNLRVLHNAAQKTDDEKRQDYKWAGLDLINGKVRNNLNAGVLEPSVSKIKCLRFATEAAITILRIDDMIKLAPKKEDMPGRHGGHQEAHGTCVCD
eukprot:TRINITY_DN343_c0_g1_i2.p2 TRINITY_DN343_c0_g1~~TRINITY_DN343_c0_g1_i2.p2  ORF type:complete len:517 (+),score=227.75 TRINITY_DN343_c0_g1_i2:389-1939(+)